MGKCQTQGFDLKRQRSVALSRVAHEGCAGNIFDSSGLHGPESFLDIIVWM